MRGLIIGLAALLAACATQAAPHPAPAAAADGPPDKVEVVYHPGTMFFSVEDGGEGRFRTGDDEDFTFAATHADFVRIRDLLAPYRETGLIWSQADGKTETFPVSEADFDRLRDIFRPYEGVRFECQRVITDGPYGHVTWSQAGHEDQQLRWDAGCVTGDAADVFRRWDEAEAMLKALRDGS